MWRKVSRARGNQAAQILKRIVVTRFLEVVYEFLDATDAALVHGNCMHWFTDRVAMDSAERFEHSAAIGDRRTTLICTRRRP